MSKTRKIKSKGGRLTPRNPGIADLLMFGNPDEGWLRRQETPLLVALTGLQASWRAATKT